MTEEDVKAAMNREIIGNQRKDVVVRLHQRYTMLRANREREELLRALNANLPAFMVGAA